MGAPREGALGLPEVYRSRPLPASLPAGSHHRRPGGWGGEGFSKPLPRPSAFLPQTTKLTKFPLGPPRAPPEHRPPCEAWTVPIFYLNKLRPSGEHVGAEGGALKGEGGDWAPKKSKNRQGAGRGPMQLSSVRTLGPNFVWGARAC